MIALLTVILLGTVGLWASTGSSPLVKVVENIVASTYSVSRQSLSVQIPQVTEQHPQRTQQTGILEF